MPEPKSKSKSKSWIPTVTRLSLNPHDIKRICVVHWNSEPLTEGQKSSYVFVKPLCEAEPFPNNIGLLEIGGDLYKRLSKDSAEIFSLGDQINVIFGHNDGVIRWLERRNESLADSKFNSLFT